MLNSSRSVHMKILFVLEHFYPYIGGAEKLFYELSTNLAQQGMEVTVVTTLFDKTLPSEEFHNGVKIVRVKCYNRFVFTLFSIPKIIKNTKGCDIIHTTTYNAALPSILAGILMRKPVFITFHEVWGTLWKKLPFTSFLNKNAFYLFEKLLLKLPFHKFIAVSDFTKSKLIESGIAENKIERIYNGIEYELFEDYETEAPEVFTYTYFGRLGISKGLELLIPAAAEFRKSHPDSIFKLIIPKQPKGIYDKIMDLIESNNLESYIDIHHNLPRQQLYQELLKSSCVVIPSYSEGFCYAAAETVALNIPIISSQRGALQEVVSGSFIGIEKQNSTSLCNALKEAYLGKWTKTSVKKFHLQDSIKMYTEMYFRKKS
ncbi:MAG: glycosyltransferase involved in cell wall biosynthesis [Saprospiraceae bacterium]|jgi:glycosyltransferase involved in cell wall biosynthesis